jgi:hypothetical protein
MNEEPEDIPERRRLSRGSVFQFASSSTVVTTGSLYALQ